ncbi:MAG: hypothetical protein K9M75_09920 [Phycisphaerae bacterium]|nr:hypothetical protein [Phycisphaerae bacterium]
MGIEKCSKCDSLLDGSAQAFVFGGEVVCGACDQMLRDGYNILGTDAYGVADDMPAGETDWDVEVAKKWRKLYLLFFVLMVIMNLISMKAGPVMLLLYFPCAMAFLYYFLCTAKLVKGYSAVKTAFTCIALLIPLVSIIILLYVDSDVYKRIKERENPELIPVVDERSFCWWGLYSFMLILIPFFGLPLGILALVKISKSGGMLYGKVLAWIAVVLNSIMLFIYGIGIVGNIVGQ